MLRLIRPNEAESLCRNPLRQLRRGLLSTFSGTRPSSPPRGSGLVSSTLAVSCCCKFQQNVDSMKAPRTISSEPITGLSGLLRIPSGCDGGSEHRGRRGGIWAGHGRTMLLARC